MREQDPSTAPASVTVQHIDINEIHLVRAALRTQITQESVRALAESIATDGLLQPIGVSVIPAGGYSLIFGRRRLEAHRLLGRARIPALVIDEPNIQEIPALAENLMRSQLSPLEEARALRTLHEEKSLSLSQLAEMTHHSECWVRDRIALLSLDENMQNAVDLKHLSIGAAQQLALITDKPLRDFYVHLATVNGASVNQCQAWFEMWRATQQLTAPGGVNPPTLYPPPSPQVPTIYCWSGEHRVPETGAITVQICADCLKMINDAKAASMAQDPAPTSAPQPPASP